MKMPFIAALVSLLFVSCSDNQDPQPKAGQYIYETNTVTASISIRESVAITVFENGRYIFQDLYGRASGSYPDMQLAFRDLDLACSFSSPEMFTATVLSNDALVPLAGACTFRYDSKVLDINGDGVLDSWQ